MFSWWILHDCSLEVVLIIFRVKNEVHLSTKGTYSTIFYTLAKTTMTHPISETNLFGIGSPEYRLLKAAAASMDFHWSDAGTTPGIQISCIREAKATRPILESIRGPKKSTDRFLYCTIDRKR